MSSIMSYLCAAAGMVLLIFLIRAISKSATDRKKLANLALFPQQNPNPVVEVLLDGTVSYMNPAAQNLFADLGKRSFSHPLLSAINARLEEFRSGKLTFLTADLIIEGRIYEQKVYALAESNILRVYSSDITKQKENEKRLANLALFPQQNPNPVIELKLDGKVSYLNPAAARRFPDMQEKGSAHPLFDVIRTKFEVFQRGELSSYACEIVLGEEVYEQKVYAIPESNLLRVYSSDITKQKENEKRLANLALFPQQNPNPVIELKLDGKVSYLNPAASRRFPDMQEKGSAHGLFDVIRPQFAAFQKGELSSFTCEISIGEEIYEQKVYAIPESKIMRVYSSDITERKRTEQIIREKNKDITDSINYAKRIQLSMLPKDHDLNEILEDHFILFMPKDIVSGDFYWSNVVTSRKNETIVEKLALVAAVDCTGHGVPGALMSIVGTTLLNQTVRNPDINSPGEALSFLNHELPKNLKGSADDEIKDGMDMTMVAFSRDKMRLYFAGAMNPIYIISGGKLTEIKGDKQPISSSPTLEKKSFTTHSFDLKPGDLVYLFTDGYADQFGGPNGKKFKYKSFQELLLKNAGLSISEQRDALQKTFLDWKGDLEQIDDVLVIGIRL